MNELQINCILRRPSKYIPSAIIETNMFLSQNCHPSSQSDDCTGCLMLETGLHFPRFASFYLSWDEILLEDCRRKQMTNSLVCCGKIKHWIFIHISFCSWFILLCMNRSQCVSETRYHDFFARSLMSLMNSSVQCGNSNNTIDCSLTKLFQVRKEHDLSLPCWRFDRNQVRFENEIFQCMSIAYRQKLTSPKWNRFLGMKLRWKDKIRLNNVIWRCWHMQFIKVIILNCAHRVTIIIQIIIIIIRDTVS